MLLGSPLACSKDSDDSERTTDATGGSGTDEPSGGSSGSFGGSRNGSGGEDDGTGGETDTSDGGTTGSGGALGGQGGDSSKSGGTDGSGGFEMGGAPGVGGTDEGSGGDVGAGCAPGLDVQDDDSGSFGAVGVPDLVISEIDPGEFLELFNTTDQDIALGSIADSLASHPTYLALSAVAPDVVVPSGGYATIDWPADLADVGSDAGGELHLVLGTQYGEANAILDFVCWGTSPASSRLGLAESAGKWSGPCATAISAGMSLQRSPSTAGTSLGDYSSDSAPTPRTCAP